MGKSMSVAIFYSQLLVIARGYPRYSREIFMLLGFADRFLLFNSMEMPDVVLSSMAHWPLLRSLESGPRSRRIPTAISGRRFLRGFGWFHQWIHSYLTDSYFGWWNISPRMDILGDDISGDHISATTMKPFNLAFSLVAFERCPGNFQPLRKPGCRSWNDETLDFEEWHFSQDLSRTNCGSTWTSDGASLKRAQL